MKNPPFTSGLDFFGRPFILLLKTLHNYSRSIFIDIIGCKHKVGNFNCVDKKSSPVINPNKYFIEYFCDTLVKKNMGKLSNMFAPMFPLKIRLLHQRSLYVQKEEVTGQKSTIVLKIHYNLC